MFFIRLYGYVIFINVIDYQEYKAKTSKFFLWPPKKLPTKKQQATLEPSEPSH
jgi:hypothetical protein